MLTARDIHERVDWPTVLQQLGIGDEFLRNKHGPCPACGGTDRYRFDNRHERGDFYCNGCGAGDGFTLLQRVFGWTFSETRKQVSEAARLEVGGVLHGPVRRQSAQVRELPASPTARVRELLRTAATPGDIADVVTYLRSRSLWPLPTDCTLRAHAAAEYWRSDNDKPRCIGRFPALLAEVRDQGGELVTLHATYLQDGQKIDNTPRKILSPLVGRVGCAVRLMPAGDTLGIAEGIETALAAAKLHKIPVWAALNTSLVAKFDPPTDVGRVVIFADRDVAGLEAALALTARLEGRTSVETRTPAAPFGDWADVLSDKGPEAA